ncbi:MAG: bifunctional UDP-N-acetylglucosamine diphosphorylase/glucosamine-1-phosphate N-acetyltransferase GlmU [Chloroflexota bacterium]|nr:bifunctional UDP-N-acetylglucosamine diphosphorylase/glucosamine-1-phosphate N-acetyltransferase GlmU [Chloroflexota bacterium]
MSSDDDPPESDPSPHVTAVVLAAGRGERLRSELPKPLYPICGRAMASYVLHALADAGVSRAVVVVPPDGRGRLIEQRLREDAPDLKLCFAFQQEPRGTADAVLAAQSQVQTTQVLVVNGDLPLLSAEQIRPVLCHDHNDAVIATAQVDDPAEMGRIIRDSQGRLVATVEYRDADPAERAIREVNLGLYVFRSDFLWNALEQIVAQTRTGEAYATDAIPCAVRNQSAIAVEVELPDGRLNVETPADAANAEAVIRHRIIDRLLNSGAHIRDRNAVWIDARASVEQGAIIEPGSHIRGNATIAQGSRIGPNAIIEASTVGRNCNLESCTVRGSVLHDNVEVGPYSTIRPGCTIESDAHIGTHVELKEAYIGEHVQIGHFSYIGDAEVGARTNIGAGAITCNFDGQSKHRTIIGEDAFIGSDTMLIAPIRIGNRARTGAGAVVNKDVPDGGNAVGHPARLTPLRQAHSTTEDDL